ncbi:glycoside hydrolase family 65 protein [Kushneria sinocarnis]|uniref:glycoside hydrolase family 65 protein n=1 Tax=Kushneria sinocarnis TaxID=595502 RepID=UPI001B863A89|nr:glycoside hydrolase family 65 protein [Kushneria sinocarnis]
MFDTHDPTDERRREALLTLGNGCLSLRASAPEAASTVEHGQEHYAGFYRAGWYDQAPRIVNGQTVSLAALVNLPNPFALSFAVGNEEWFNLANSELLDYHQALSLENGLLSRELTIRSPGGWKLQLVETRLVSMASPQVGALRWCLCPLGWEGQLRLRSVLDAGVHNAAITRQADYEGPRLRRVVAHHNTAGEAAVGAQLYDPGQRVTVAAHSRLGSAHGVIRPEWHSVWDGTRVVQETEIPVSDGQSVTLDRIAAVHVDDEISTGPRDPQGLHYAMASHHETPGFDTLMAAHVRAWQHLWAQMPLTAMSLSPSQALHLHRFHLLQTLSPHSVTQDLGFPPRGWQEGYFGQVFWDELFAFPFLASHFPAIARSLLHYRHRRLETARARARRAGYRGAMFPWRSARSGEEETPPFQFNPLTRSWKSDHSFLQRHIGTAIAYNAWHYWQATGDRTMLAGEGGELLLEIARFWASMAQYDDSLQRYVIRGVLGPDEYHDAYPGRETPGFDNNAYTNVMAVWTLSQACDVMDQLLPEEAAALCDRLTITPDELTHWDHVSRHMYIPFIGTEVISQFEGFEKLASPPAMVFSTDHPRADWWLASQGRSVDEYQLTKQADVLMLLYLLSPDGLQALLARLGYTFDSRACRHTTDYYMARITHESSLSRVVCAGALIQLDPQTSWHFFCQSLHTDLQAPGNLGTREGVHLGAMAGTLDVLQRHYLGINPAEDGLHVTPTPPPELGDVSMTMTYHGNHLMLALTKDELHLTASTDSDGVIPVIHSKGISQLHPGETCCIAVEVKHAGHEQQ